MDSVRLAESLPRTSGSAENLLCCVADAEERAAPAVTQQPASEQTSSSERAAEQPPALHATRGMRHMRRKVAKGKSVRRIQRQPASDAAATPTSALSSAEAAQSDTDNGVPHSKSAAFGDGATDAALHSGRATEAEAPTEVVLRVVTDSGLVMSRPARRASAAAAAACLQQNLPKVQCCATISNTSLPCIFIYVDVFQGVPSLLGCMLEVAHISIIEAPKICVCFLPPAGRWKAQTRACASALAAS